jgi:hypothetical protein
VNILTTLAKYLNADFSPMEFGELFANQPLFTQVDLSLNDNLSQLYTIKPPVGGHIISDIQKYLKCFQLVVTSNFKVSIAVKQPIPGTRETYATNGQPGKIPALADKGSIDVGHTFLILEQEKADGTKVVRSLGLYPSNGCNPKNPISPGLLVDDSDHILDISTTYDVSAANFSILLDNIKATFGVNYDLNNYNCTGFAIDQLQKINIPLPKTKGTWPLGKGLNPGDLGEDLKNSAGVKNRFSTGLAPLNQGICN